MERETITLLRVFQVEHDRLRGEKDSLDLKINSPGYELFILLLLEEILDNTLFIPNVNIFLFH